MSNFSVRKARLEEAAQLYDSFIEPYFPEAEKKPLAAIERMMKTGLYEIICLLDEEKVCGVAFLTTHPGGSSYLLDYLAVDKDYRSKGCGGLLLRSCMEEVKGLPIIIETEDLENAKTAQERLERQKRNSFYVHNGVRSTGVKSSIWGVIYENWLLQKEDQLMEQDWTIKELRLIYTFMFHKPEVYKEKVIIPLR